VPDGASEAPTDLVERLQNYMLKSVREAKLHTSWLTPNQQYEDALRLFVERVLRGPGASRFLPLMIPFQRWIAAAGVLNSLSQVVMKLGSPGVPDFYQGTELWELSLVDPDNRRPVDFESRQALLTEVHAILDLPYTERALRLAELLLQWRDGRIKLLTTAVGLRMRRENPDLFHEGAYVPIEAEVTVPAGAVAFARTLGDTVTMFVGPRLCARLVHSEDLQAALGFESWKTSRILLPPQLAGRSFRHELTGGDITPTTTSGQSWILLSQIFEHVPVGILRAV